MDEDAELMRRGKAGEVGAFWQVAHRHRAMVYRVARGILGSRDDAEDVVQDVLLRAYRALGRYDTCREPAAWLRAIAVNCSITACRRRARSGGSVDFSLVANVRGSDQTPEHYAVAGETWTRIRAAMDSLSPRQRAVVTLSAFDDLAIGDIAQTMGCSVTTAKTHLHRAREHLARALADAPKEG
jgi:RNA polymerase sigma-70 factor (ECF subfamily)